jgi:pyruvate dehydrogenase E1 component
MYGANPEDIFYYVTLYNENYPMPAMPAHVRNEDITRGLYKFADAPADAKLKAAIVFSGSAHSAAREAANELLSEFGVGVELWSATSYKALREEALECERIARLNPDHPPATPLVARLLNNAAGPIVAVSDFMRIVPEQVARFVTEQPFVPLGTDGMGRSDTREALRRHFETDTANIVVTVLHTLQTQGKVPAETVSKALAKYGLSPNTPSPFLEA